MDPVPYEIRKEDVDEVLDAYEPVGGSDWPDEARAEANRAGDIGDRPGESDTERDG